MSSRDDLDKLLDEIGMGRWQIPGVTAYLTVLTLYLVTSVGSTFFNPPLEFYCLKPEFMEKESKILSLHQERYCITRNFTEISFDSQCLEQSDLERRKTSLTTANVLVQTTEASCKDCKSRETTFENHANQQVAGTSDNQSNVQFCRTQQEACPFVTYDRTTFASTVMTEWNLICNQSLYFYLFQDLSTYGMTLGCIFGGSVGDRFGRARTTLICSIAILIGNVVVAAASNFSLVLCGRFLVGLTLEMAIINSFAWIMETCPMSFRGIIGMVPGMFSSAAAAFFALLASFLTSWRILYLSVAWPAVVIVLCAWFMEPSPRWLQQKGKLEFSKKVLWRAVKTNKSTLEAGGHIDELHKVDVRYSKSGGTLQLKHRGLLREIYSSPSTRHITMVLPLLKFLTKLTYSAVFFYADVFAKSNPFMFFAFAAIADFVGVLACVFILDRLGRKPGTAGVNIVAGALILINIAVPTHMKWLQWTLLLVAFVLCSGSAQAQYVYTAELFPTVIRARGLSLGGLFGTIGMLAAPYVAWYLKNYGWWVTQSVLGLCCFTAGLFGLTLPETNNVPACETISDVERRAERLKATSTLSTFRNLFTSERKSSTEVNTDGETSSTLVMDERKKASTQDAKKDYGATV